MKPSSVPFRILGTHNGHTIVMRTFPDCVTISIGLEHHSFQTYDSAMLYLQQLAKQSRYRERNNHVNHNGSP